MLISTSQKRKYLNVNDFKLHLYGNFIPVVSYIKILGLFIDSNLTWRVHVDFLCKKISSLIGLFYKIKDFLNYVSKIMFYNSYILPRSDYCLTIWGNAPKSSTEKIFRLQKRAVRIVLNVPKDSPSAYVFNQLKWMSLYQRIFYQKCLLMYCIINNVYPSYLHTYVKAHLVNHYILDLKIRICLYHFLIKKYIRSLFNMPVLKYGITCINIKRYP